MGKVFIVGIGPGNEENRTIRADRALEAGDVIATFVGHDHVNDYVATWKGLLLGYGRFTGGKTVYHDVPGGNGARVIELKEGTRAFRTWIRLKDGVTTQPFEWQG